MEYEQVQDGDENIEIEDEKYPEGIFPYVQFDAFFLRDITGDGYAESIRGSCREIGKQDTLYIELNVLDEGYLEDGATITINGDRNFYFETAIVKDKEVKENYVGTNVGEIKLNEVNNGTQKLLTGVIKSGNYNYSYTKADAIGKNIENYSKVNSVTLKGTHVIKDEEGNETSRVEIEKTVEFKVDWHGSVGCTIKDIRQENDIAEVLDEEAGELNLSFYVQLDETKEKLNLKKTEIKATIPVLNECEPLRAEVKGNNVTYNYDGATRTLTAQSEGTLNENKIVTSNPVERYQITITYPIEAYGADGIESIQIRVPVEAKYEGYNNPNTEFENPYISNTAKATVIITYQTPAKEQRTAGFKIYVGKYMYKPYERYVVSKEKPLRIYNEISESEKDDTYLVTWYGYTGTQEQTEGMIFRDTVKEENTNDIFIKTNNEEESMENVSKTIGIYFSDPTNVIGEEGEIKVYDDETGILLVTFTKDTWNKYNSTSPYKFEIGIQHIRVETSKVNPNKSLNVYLVKEIEDEYLIENYTREEFDELQYIKSSLSGYIGERYVNTATHQAHYEAPLTEAQITASNTAISTQETERNEILTVKAMYRTNSNEVKWVNGAFLLKLPKEIIDLEINSVEIDNKKVKIASYEQFTQEEVNEKGENEKNIFIKIITENETEQSFDIKVDCNITPDPRIATTSKPIELYAYNQNGTDYYNGTEDKYDVNNNLVTTDTVGKATINLQLISPQSLLTSETANNYDEKGSIAVAPQVAIVSKTQQEATIDINLVNNYSNTVSEVKILGKIPKIGNRYVINGTDLESTFDTELKEAIELPTSLKNVAKIYYSEQEEVTDDLKDEANEWKDGEVEEIDFSKVKSFLIDLGDYELPIRGNQDITYKIKIPSGLEYNKYSYSHHAVYFCLDTENGKYRTQTEPNKLGFRIAKQYDVELTKYQTGTQKKIEGATYYLWEDGQEEGKTKVTSKEGKIELTGLYIERTYCIKELKSPTEYELNAQVIKFKAKEGTNGELVLENVDGIEQVESKEVNDENHNSITVEKPEDGDYKVVINVEDEVKANLIVTKVEKNEDSSSSNSGSEPSEETLDLAETSTPIKGVRFKITGEGLPGTGKILTTNKEGKLNLKGLKIGAEYTLEEIKAAEGYYIANKIKFVIKNNEGNYTAKITEPAEGEENLLKSNTTTEDNEIPTINFVIENEKIPTYNLTIKKIDKGNSDNLLSGAKFKLIKDGKELGRYETGKVAGTDEEGEKGIVTIENLYAYEEAKQIEQTYLLQEVLAPEGYAKLQDIEFKVTKGEDGNFSLESMQGTITETQVEKNNITIILEDSPSFKLIKREEVEETEENNVQVETQPDESLGTQTEGLEQEETVEQTGKLLPNTKFVIYNVDDGTVPARNSKGEIIGKKEIIDGKEYYTLTTNEQGEITADLPQGLYKAVEVQASEDKYALAEETYFGIGTSREAEKVAVPEWATSVGGEKNEEITCITETSDGGYIVGGYFKSTSITVGEKTLTNAGSTSYTDGMIIKYRDVENENGYEVEWVTSVGGSNSDQITCIATTSDGGFIVGGCFESSSITVEDKTLTSAGHSEGMIIKYNSDNKVEWATPVGGQGRDYITCITEASDEGYICRRIF